MHVIADGPPAITVTPSVASGARTATFQVTGSGTLSATVFRDSEAQAVIAKSIEGWVPGGFRLNAAPVVTDYQVENSNAKGDVTVTGKATGYLVVNLSVDALRLQLRGLSAGAARDAIEAAAPGSRVEIRMSPLSAPLLPFDTARISISVS